MVHQWLVQQLVKVIIQLIINKTFDKVSLLDASGPHLASSLNVQNLSISSKNNPDGHLFAYG